MLQGPENLAYTFDTFVVSEATRIAWTTCVAIAANSEDAPNPLFLHGPTGSGKSHLIHAVSHAIRRHRPQAIVQQIAADAYVASLVAAIRRNQPHAFAHCEALLLDDFPAMGDTPATEEGILHRVTRLVSSGVQVVVTSAAPPGTAVSERLASLPRAGIAELAYPDRDARAEILRRAAMTRGVTLTESLLHSLADQCAGSPRTLESVVTRIAAEAMISPGLLSESRIHQLAEHVLRPSNRVA